MFSLDSYAGGWNLNFFRGLNERECAEFASLMMILEGFSLRFLIPDTRIWLANPSGVFSVKSSYEKLIECLDSPPFPPSSLIWNSRVPLQVKVFVWSAVHKGINTTGSNEEGPLFMQVRNGVLCVGKQLSWLIIFSCTVPQFQLYGRDFLVLVLSFW